MLYEGPINSIIKSKTRFISHANPLVCDKIIACSNIFRPSHTTFDTIKRTVGVIIFSRRHLISIRLIMTHPSVIDLLDWVVRIPATYLAGYDFDSRIRDRQSTPSASPGNYWGSTYIDNCLPFAVTLDFCLAYSSTLKMEATYQLLVLSFTTQQLSKSHSHQLCITNLLILLLFCYMFQLMKSHHQADIHYQLILKL
jgi:hypothetical protein